MPGQTADHDHIETCPRCRGELVVIGIPVDGADLVMRSCATCDVRTWHLGHRPVDLHAALAEVGQASGRRRR